MLLDSNSSTINYKPLSFMGYKGYRVGNDGSVWSRRRGGSWSDWRQLKPIGGREVGLYDDQSKLKRFRINRIVLTAFVGPCPNGMEGCHNDGNETNNKLSNLRWDTHINNEKDKIGHGTRLSGERIGNSKLKDDEVRKIRRLRDRGWSCPRLAKKFKVSTTMIYYIVNGKWWRDVV